MVKRRKYIDVQKQRPVNGEEVTVRVITRIFYRILDFQLRSSFASQVLYVHASLLKRRDAWCLTDDVTPKWPDGDFVRKETLSSVSRLDNLDRPIPRSELNRARTKSKSFEYCGNRRTTWRGSAKK